MSQFKVVMTSPRLATPAVALLEAAGCTIHYMPPYPTADAVAALTAEIQADAILTRQGPVTSAAMDASPNLRIVARHGVGVDDVDLAAAAARGILVTRAPGSNTTAVAEHTMALLLALVKDLRPLGASIATGAWRGAATKVRDVSGMRLGLIGYGAIGHAVAIMAAAFAMRVEVLSPRPPGGNVARAASLGELMADSDVISLHCPYSAATHHLIDARALSLMPAGGFIINTARGGLIDEAALLASLDRGHCAGAGLDVFETEPPVAGDALRNHPRVLVTPHVSGVTDGSLVNMGVMAAECIAWALTGAAIPPERIVRS